ncbi:nitrilase-related carbon-nitrogen hydrolase [Streptomyces chartreusis]|uniref:nitrilase-related carbon-nitrogen hydrolase n=1 Tax=Streptomyces chartreusis TaxID=1969 RepID=UPI00123D18B9|nr:nitrilase-related carbon-nitrogen hydrolase [Streptomyces chartreusis]QEV65568.1 nitrilase [Streptomyces chartreusis]GGW93620.1 nitrilase [Streptomyces chartreusis]
MTSTSPSTGAAGTSRSTVTAAVVQAAAPLFDTKAALNRAEELLREAVTDRGADVVVLPEAFLGGYPKGLDFDISVGRRTPAGRELFRRYHDAAIDVPGPEIDILAALTRELGCHAVVGAVERQGGTLYCVALLFGPDGYLGLHRKLMPTAAERYLWGQGDGSTLPVVDTGAARLGAAICWENYMPLFRTAMYAKGVDLWCAPTVDDRDAWQATMRHIALEGRCFVLSANQYLRRDALPADLHPVQGDEPDTVLIGGGSVIVSPLGEVLAGPLRDGEGILAAELDLDDLTRARFDFDPTGHYARPDVFTLHVDESARTAVTRG